MINKSYNYKQPSDRCNLFIIGVINIYNRYFLLYSLSAFIFLDSAVNAQTLNPGVDRWIIKTSLPTSPQRKTVSLNTLLSLDNPISNESTEYETKRIPATVNGLKEGDLITTTGWIELVALENDAKKHRDGDYHIQIRTNSEWGDSCLIVEIPLPEFITDNNLRAQCAKARAFVKTMLLNNREPSRRGTVLTHPVYVRITGQLFFDAAHLKGGLRGKTPKGYEPMHSYISWELHPVTAIEFAPIRLNYD